MKVSVVDPMPVLRQFVNESADVADEGASMTVGGQAMSETRLTPARRAELARLCEAATPGPWAYESIAEKSNEWAVGQAFREVNGEYVPVGGRVESGEVEDTIIERRLVGMNESGHASFADAAFIAAARTALLEALAELDRLSVVDPMPVLRQFVKTFPSQRHAAAKLGISQQYLTDILHGRRDFSDRILQAIGLQRVIIVTEAQP